MAIGLIFCVSIKDIFNKNKKDFISIIVPNGERNIIEHDIKQKGLKDMRRLYKVEKKKDNGINDNALKDMRIMFESDNKDYYQPVRFTNAFDDNFIEYESNGDKDKTLSIEEYLDKIIPYLGDIINDHKTQGEWKYSVKSNI